MINRLESPRIPTDLIPIGSPFPQKEFEELDPSHFRKLTKITPLGDTFYRLINDFNHGEIDFRILSRKKITPEEAIDLSNRYGPGYLAWQAVRHAGGPAGYKLTGFEGYEIGHEIYGMKDDPTAIALKIALRGFAFHTHDTDLANKLLGEGLQKLKHSELTMVDDELGGWIRAARAEMTREAQEFQRNTHASIDELPSQFQKIYYSEVPYSGKLFQTYIIPVITPIPDALRKPGNVLALAQRLGVNITENELKLGRSVVKMISQCGSPLARIFMPGEASIK